MARKVLQVDVAGIRKENLMARQEPVMIRQETLLARYIGKQRDLIFDLIRMGGGCYPYCYTKNKEPPHWRLLYRIRLL